MPSVDDLLLEKKRYGLEQKVSKEELEMLNQNMPIQYIIGYVEYANVKINLNNKVLIPRYETEELIHLFLNNYAKENVKVLDLCCGSGFIGLALKKNKPSLDVTLSDNDNEALLKTKENELINFGKNGVVKIVESDLFTDINDKFDVIISNPPYIAFDDPDAQSLSLKHEPIHAIFAKDNGLYFYKKIIKEAPKFLNKEGLLIFEINPKHIKFWDKVKNAKIMNDMSQKPRFAILKF